MVDHPFQPIVEDIDGDAPCVQQLDPSTHLRPSNVTIINHISPLLNHPSHLLIHPLTIKLNIISLTSHHLTPVPVSPNHGFTPPGAARGLPWPLPRKELQTALSMAIPTEFNGSMSFVGDFADENHL